MQAPPGPIASGCLHPAKVKLDSTNRPQASQLAWHSGLSTRETARKKFLSPNVRILNLM